MSTIQEIVTLVVVRIGIALPLMMVSFYYFITITAAAPLEVSGKFEEDIFLWARVVEGATVQ